MKESISRVNKVAKDTWKAHSPQRKWLLKAEEALLTVSFKR